MSGHVEQNCSHGLARQPGSNHAKYCAASEQAEGEDEELRTDLLRPRAQCHAHADFTAALGHGVTQHPVRADGDEQQSHR